MLRNMWASLNKNLPPLYRKWVWKNSFWAQRLPQVLYSWPTCNIRVKFIIFKPELAYEIKSTCIFQNCSLEIWSSKLHFKKIGVQNIHSHYFIIPPPLPNLAGARNGGSDLKTWGSQKLKFLTNFSLWTLPGLSFPLKILDLKPSFS